MEPNNEMRERLLSQLPSGRDLAGYRQQVAATLERNQKRIRAEKILATGFWFFCAATATAYIWFGNNGPQFARAPFVACIFIVLGGVEVLKYHIHSAQVELHKEMKQLQVQMLEMQSSVGGSSGGS